MPVFEKLSVIFLSLFLLSALSACEKKEGPAERVGKKIDESVEKMGEKIEEAGDKAKEATKR